MVSLHTFMQIKKSISAAEEYAQIDLALAKFEELTCIRFRRMENEDEETNYLIFGREN